ncbi:MAG TPA: SDR family oxidoreductase [Solirubrobacteraceae bacterium]|nr:SDR family oxidoreductase [Solirubrobacteraceae bacterium]
MPSLDGNVAIITGGRRGIGRAIADGLAAEGARIAILDVVGAEDAATAYDGGLGLSGDVSSETDVARMVEAVASHFGRIDILVNNAAIFAKLKMTPFTEIAFDDWRRVLDVNVGGVFLMCRAVVPHLRQQGGGKIVNISSGTFFRGVPFMLHYVTSKSAIIGLTRALARELGPDNICVNAIAPGYTVTEATLEQDETHTQVGVVSVKARAIQREQRPEDLVGSAIFLCGRGSNFVTGQTFAVDGGAHFQ